MTSPDEPGGNRKRPRHYDYGPQSLEDVLAAARSAWLGDSSGWRSGIDILKAAARYRISPLRGGLVLIRVTTARLALEGAVAVERAGGVPVLWPGRAGMPGYVKALPYLEHGEVTLAGRPRLRHAMPKAVIGVSSGGTTGAGKVVLLDVAKAMANARAVAEAVSSGPPRRVASLRSLAFSAGLVCDVLASLVSGDQVAAIPVSSALLGTRAVMQYRPDAVNGTPTVVAEVCRELPSTIRRIVVSGEPVSPQRLHKICSAQPTAAVMNAYGLSEAGPRVSVGAADLHPEGVSCGVPIRDVAIRLDPDTHEVTVTTPYHAVAVLGECGLVGQGATVNTGDTGVLGRGGILIVLGRRDRQAILQGTAYNTEIIESSLSDICPGATVAIDHAAATLIVTIPGGRDEVAAEIQPVMQAHLREHWPMLSRVRWHHEPRQTGPAQTVTEAGKVRRFSEHGSASKQPDSSPE